MIFKLILLVTFSGAVFGATKNKKWTDVSLEADALANPLEYPFVVGISKGMDITSSICGGTIYNNQIIITAASCFDDMGDPDSIYYHTYWTNKHMSHPIKKIIKHENYDPITQANDIALLQTADEIMFDEGTGPAPLPTPEFDTLDIRKALIFGINFGGPLPPYKLVGTKVKVTSLPHCLMSWNVTEDQVCVILENGHCIGSTIGFPMVQTQNGAEIVSGFGSFIGEECSAPAVFTKMTTFLDWIDKTSSQLS